MTYAETLDFLFSSLPVFQREGAAAYKPGLENTRSFNELLGNPDRAFRSIHIAGTNGKGSVSHILAAVLQAAGYRTGLFTSPHLKDFRERIRIDGEMISEEEVIAFTEKHQEQMVARGLTFFEMCAALAFDHFARNGVEVAVIETGLGGRLDATNIISPILSVITNIGLDHTNLLGNTLPEIAFEKAGIIKPSTPVIVGCHHTETDPVFVQRAAEEGAPLYFATDRFRIESVEHLPDSQRFSIATGCGSATFEIALDLLGDYQRHNIVTALAACEQLSGIFDIPHEAIAAGCRAVQRSTGLRGRWQILFHSPLTVCDTGHNAHGIKEIAAQINRTPYEKLYIIIGVVADKDLDAILPLLPRDAYYLFTQPSTPRALDRHLLAEAAARKGLRGEIAESVPAALEIAQQKAAPEDMIFIGGSTFVVADIF